jgi:hypothetical protein
MWCCGKPPSFLLLMMSTENKTRGMHNSAQLISTENGEMNTHSTIIIHDSWISRGLSIIAMIMI